MTLGKTVRYDQKWAFQLEIDGFTSAHFSTVTGYESEIDIVEHSPGGAIIPEKAPGRANFSNLVCERGVGVDEEAYEWFIETVDAAAGIGSDTPFRSVDLVHLTRSQIEKARTTFFDAFPAKYVGGEWDGEASEVVIETLELAYYFFEKTPT
jgi:phage tail-like protein